MRPNINMMNVPATILLFASVALIYVLSPTPLMLLGLILVLATGIGMSMWWGMLGTIMVAALTMVFSSIALAFAALGMGAEFTTVIVVVIVWLILLGVLFLSVERRTVYIPPDVSVLVKQLDTVNSHNGPTSDELRARRDRDGMATGRVITTAPFMQQVIARLPLYALGTKVEVTDIDVKNLSKIIRVDVVVGYAIVEPLTVYATLCHDKESKALNYQSDSEMMSLTFWEGKLSQLVQQRTPGMLRAVIFESGREKVKEFYDDRTQLANALKARLEPMFQRIGIEIRHVAFATVEVPFDKVKIQSRNKERELEEATHKARCVAREIEVQGEALAHAKAEALALWLDKVNSAIEKMNVNMSGEQVAAVMSTVVEKMNLFNTLEEERLKVLQEEQKGVDKGKDTSKDGVTQAAK